MIGPLLAEARDGAMVWLCVVVGSGFLLGGRVKSRGCCKKLRASGDVVRLRTRSGIEGERRSWCSAVQGRGRKELGGEEREVAGVVVGSSGFVNGTRSSALMLGGFGGSGGEKWRWCCCGCYFFAGGGGQKVHG